MLLFANFERRLTDVDWFLGDHILYLYVFCTDLPCPCMLCLIVRLLLVPHHPLHSCAESNSMASAKIGFKIACLSWLRKAVDDKKAGHCWGKARQGIKNSIMCIEPNKTHWPGKCRAQTPVCFVDGFFRAEDKSWHWNTWRNVLRYAVGARTSKALFRLETWLGFGINFAVKCRRKQVWNGWKSSEEREREMSTKFSIYTYKIISKFM